jgi:protein-S-isoprenylcysteine O-methyltransferase Ste14
MAELWIHINFWLYCVVFIFALVRNRNFNIFLVGTIYLAPLIPLGLTPENSERFLIISLLNTIFGTIELVVFAVTVESSDITFDRPYFMQLLGHVFPIAAAIIGLSYLARHTGIPVAPLELSIIAGLFIFGSILRVVAVCQLGKLGFKFDIAFRKNQRLKTDQLYGWMRHPSYTAMMLVILAYAVTTHAWEAAILGVLSAWFGFQYRIHHEEKALAEQFGQEYIEYRGRTGMWLPIW